MIYNKNSFLKIISPAAFDQENRKIATEKLKTWVASHKKEMDEVKSALKSKREMISAKITQDDLLKDAIRQLGGYYQTNWPDEIWNYYQIIENFIKNKLFEFKFETFYPFILKKTFLNNGAPLDKESLTIFLAENQAEVGDISIDDYLNGKKDNQESKRFFYSLNRKLENETVEMSNLVAELLSLHLSIECDDWSSVATNIKLGLTFQDFLFLIARHFYTAEKISNETFLFLEEWFKKQEEAISLDKAKMYQSLLMSEVCIISNDLGDSPAELAFFDFIHQAPVDFALMRFLWVRNDLIGNVHPNKIIKPSNTREAGPMSLAVLKHIKQDPSMIKMLMDRDFFYNTNLSPKFLKEHQIDPKKVGEILYHATCEKTKDIWRHFCPEAFSLINASDAGKLKKSVPHLDLILTVRRYVASTWAKFAPTKDGVNKVPKKKVQSKQVTVAVINDAHKAMTDYFLRACSDAIYFDALLNDRDFKHRVHDYLVLSINSYRGKCPMCPLPSFLKSLDELHAKRGQIWDIILSSGEVISELKMVEDHRRQKMFVLSPFLSKQYHQEISATKKETKNKTKPVVISEEQKKANKAFAEQQNKVVPMPAPDRKPISKLEQIQPATTSEQPAPQEKKMLDLTPKQIEDFLNAIRAVFAGNQDVAINWVAEKTKDVAGYFTVDFPEPNKKFKINSALNQTQTEFTLTEEQWRDFFYTYVPSRLSTQLPEVAVLKENNRLRLIPKGDHCSYPVDMHGDAFKHLRNKGAPVVSGHQASIFKLKKTAHHSASSLQSPISLIAKPEDKKVTSDKQKGTEQEVFDMFDAVKKALGWMMEDDFDHKSFHFLKHKQKRKECIIQVNLKAAPDLSNKKQQRVSTYALMKCMVETLRSASDLRIFISPDEADQVKNGQCSITIKSKKEKVKEILSNVSVHAKDVFKKQLEAYYILAEASEIENETREVIVLRQAEENNQVPVDMIQRFQIDNEQLICIGRLLTEAKLFNIQLMDTQLDPIIRLGLSAQKNVCYHRIFQNLTTLFEANNDATYASYADAYRNVFRHAHNELKGDFMQAVDAFIQSISQYKTKSKTNLFMQDVIFISWGIQNNKWDAFVHQITPYVQEKSNHNFGSTTKDERKALIPTWKNAIKQIYAMQLIDESIKQSMIIALASLIGEVEKNGTPYQTVFVEMGTHKQNTAESPGALTNRVYTVFINKIYSELTLSDENSENNRRAALY